VLRLQRLARAIDRVNETIGQIVAWAALALVVLVFALVVLRYVFGLGAIFAEEAAIYLHAALFLLAAGYTLLHDAHVRVDVFYRDAAPRTKAWIDLLGTLLLLLPVCVLLWWVSWPYVAASWAVRESSPEASGIPAVFLLKTLLLVFPVILALQGAAMALHALLVLTWYESPPERREGLPPGQEI